MLEFCPVCKRLLQVKEENGKTIGYCSCGFKRMSGINLSSVDKNEDKKDFSKRGEGVVSNEFENSGVLHKCKKCGHEYAEITDLGERTISESNVYLYKCLKCGNVDRESGGKS